MISGAFKSMAAAALDIKLFLLPMKLQIQRTVEETAIRIRTGPAWACPDIAKSRSPGERRLGGLTPLETFAQGRNAILKLGKEEEWETREAYILRPWEEAIPVLITKDPEEALKRHDTACRDTPVSPEHAIWYTDESGYQGLVSGSAVSPRSGQYL